MPEATKSVRARELPCRPGVERWHGKGGNGGKGGRSGKGAGVQD